MLFTSLSFLIFLAIVFGLHWFACGGGDAVQNALLVVAGYVLYGWLDWRFYVWVALRQECCHCEFVHGSHSIHDFGDGVHLNDIGNAVWTRKMNELVTED